MIAGPLAMTVPGHHAARLDGELAHAELAVLDALLLVDVDHGDDGVGDTGGLEVDGLGCVGFLLIGGALAGEGAGGHQARAEHSAGKQGGTAEPTLRIEWEHLRLTPLARGVGRKERPLR
jgi:hypothetical protein